MSVRPHRNRVVRSPAIAPEELSRRSRTLGLRIVFPPMTDSGFFEELYRDADRDRLRLGWTKPGPAPILTAWLEDRPRTPARAIVVACGVGEDAEHLASLGWDVVAFDLSPTAIEWSRERSPESVVDYRLADLFALPEEWLRAYDLVVEVSTIQAIHPDQTTKVIKAIAELVGDGGTLLVATLTSGDTEPGDGPPWPVHPGALDAFTAAGLVIARQDEAGTTYPSVESLEIEYRRL